MGILVGYVTCAVVLSWLENEIEGRPVPSWVSSFCWLSVGWHLADMLVP